MDYETVIERLVEMKGRYDIGFSSTDRSFLDSLYYDLYGKHITRTGCSDCYRDAYMEISIRLKRDKTMPKKSNYELKPGAVITFFGEAKAYTNANLTDEVAIRFLALNPDNRKLFTESIPSDWEDKVAEYKIHCTNDNAVKESEMPSADVIAEKDARIAHLEAELAEKDVDLRTAEVERDNLRNELAEANKSLETALAENESLKAASAPASKSTRSKKAKSEPADAPAPEAPAEVSAEQSLDLGAE